MGDITVRVLAGGNSFEVRSLRDSDTILTLKQKIEQVDRFRYPVARQQLTYRGTALSNNQTLLYYMIASGSQVELQVSQ